MAQHIIPDIEKENHNETQDCICEPELKIDDETGEMVWIHNTLNFEKYFEDFIKI